MSWRYVADDGVTAGFGLAADEYITRQVGRGDSPPTLRLYTYRSHCVLEGRFQLVDSEVDRECCEREGIAINRRPTGGGTILMGAEQLGIAIMVPEGRTAASYEQSRELFARFSSGIVKGLQTLGVSAELKRKNDVEVNGRKIAGLGIFFEPSGGLLFHASLLVDLDIPLMLRLLKTPFQKISDKEIATVAERVTTLRRECSHSVSVAEVRDRIRVGYEEKLGVECEGGVFTERELEGIRSLEKEKYTSTEWLELRTLLPDATGSASLKTEGGLLAVSLALVGDTTKAIYLTGDFFAEESAVASIERSLRWHPATREAVLQTLNALEGDGVKLPRVKADEITQVVMLAAEAARQQQRSALSKGCFVDP
ncbi:MAG: biotin/lipoate A/B protein ligase family protein [Candidatus Methylomirabilia bacterium]